MKMPTWIIYGIIASLCLGSYVIASKIAISGKYFERISPAWTALFMLLGIAVIFIIAVIKEGFPMPISKPDIGFAVLSGILWGLGMYFVLKAIAIGADIAKLTPLYNTNTLVAVLLGIILLHELPKAGDIARVAVGAVLIVAGAILVSFR